MIRKSSFQTVIRKNKDDFIGIGLTRYPNFILSDRTRYLENVPVFVFHEVAIETLEPLLLYLTDNGYRTINANELAERQTSSKLGSGQEVVLTFDDGHRSLWSVAYPLLRKYGCTGVAFIPSGLIEEEGSGSVLCQTTVSRYLCSWKEIQEMHNSGLINFQAHSLYHSTVYVSPKIVDYVTPFSNFSPLENDYFPILEDTSQTKFPDSLQLGTPLYESGFRLQGKLRYLDSIGLRQACGDFVLEHGNEQFFRNNGWMKRLNGFVKRVFTDFAGEARYETIGERNEAIRHDFRRAKDILERKLRGKIVRHFCFPWFSGCPLAVRISAEEGYVTNFWGGIIPKFAKLSSNPIPIPRFNPIYILRLPGKGRKSLREVLKINYLKILRRKFKYE